VGVEQVFGCRPAVSAGCYPRCPRRLLRWGRGV